MNCIKHLHNMFAGKPVTISIDFTENETILIISPKLIKDKEEIKIRPVIVRGTLDEIESLDWSTLKGSEELRKLVIDLTSIKEDLEKEVEEKNEDDKKKSKSKTAAKPAAKSKPAAKEKKAEPVKEEPKGKVYDFKKCEEAVTKGNYDMAVYLVKQMLEKDPENGELLAKLDHYESVRENARAVEEEQKEVLQHEESALPPPLEIALDDDLVIKPN